MHHLLVCMLLLFSLSVPTATEQYPTVTVKELTTRRHFTHPQFTCARSNKALQALNMDIRNNVQSADAGSHHIAFNRNGLLSLQLNCEEADPSSTTPTIAIWKPGVNWGCRICSSGQKHRRRNSPPSSSMSCGKHMPSCASGRCLPSTTCQSDSCSMHRALSSMSVHSRRSRSRCMHWRSPGPRWIHASTRPASGSG